MLEDKKKRVFNEPPVAVGEGRNVTVVVNQGDSAKEIGAMLEKNLLIMVQFSSLQEMLERFSVSISKPMMVIKLRG